MRIQSIISHFAACAVLTTLASCSDSESAGSSQVVATVGGKELTAAQFDARLSRLPAGVDKRDPEVLKTVLKNLVDETLLAQAAEKDGLDKRPAVARDIENSRNVVLATAYLNGKVFGRPASEVAIRRWYNNNPASFAERRIYRLTDLTILESAPGAAVVIAEMKRPDATVDSVVAVARANNAQLSRVSGVQSGDALPVQLADRLTSLEPSDTAIYRVARTQHFTRLDEVTASPVPFAAAHDAISNLLIVEARQEAVQAKMNQLRASGEVEYGDIGRRIQAGEGASAARPANRASQSQERSRAIAGGAQGL